MFNCSSRNAASCGFAAMLGRWRSRMFTTRKRVSAFFAALSLAGVAMLSACGWEETPVATDSPGTGTTAEEATGGAETTGGETADEGTTGDQDFSGTTLNVVAAWSGAEQSNFEQVLAAFSEQTGAEVTYTSFGDNGPTYISGQL